MPGRYKKISGADMIDNDRDVYRRPYLILFNGMTDARMALERGDPALAKDLLRRAQEDAEDAFAPDPDLLWYGGPPSREEEP